jgi:hypothetical protein
LTSIKDNIGGVATTALEIITNFINGIAEGLPGVINSAFNLIISFINGLADAIEGNNGALVAAVDKLITAVIHAIGQWFEKVQEKGARLAGKVGAGIKSMVGDVTKKAGALGDAIKGKLESFWETMKGVGTYLIEGLAEGILSAKDWLVEQANTVGSALEEGWNRFWGIESPSKVMMESGGYMMEGLANGLSTYSKYAIDSAEAAGESVKDTLGKTLSGIPDVANLDVDSQPTIRPVLDLSAVETGMSAIDKMFGANQAIGIAANVATVNGVNAMMSNRQNGATNDDVVMAIDKLNKKLDSVGGTTYNLNGMSYTGDADLDSAFQTIIQAARLERRS